MEIGEFSRKTNLAIDTLRYYDKIELIVPDRENNRRVYTEVDFEKAVAIKKLKSLGFSLKEIKSLFDLEELIESTNKLSNEKEKNLKSCLEIIKEKHNEMIKKEKEIQNTKRILERMIIKTDDLLQGKNNIEEVIK